MTKCSEIIVSAMIGAAVFAAPALAQTAGLAPDASQLINEDIIADLREMMASPIVSSAVSERNAARATLTQDEVDALDLIWREETKSNGAQPHIALALGSPLSTYLLRQQAASKGLYYEIFVMDLKGLNVGQSSITSDFWQGDEAKFQKTVPFGAGTVFIDEPEFNDETGVWVAQVNMTLDDKGEVIGGSTIEVNLTELERRQSKGLS